MFFLFFFSIDDIYDLEYQSVKVRGEFDHSHSVLIGPRSYDPEKSADTGGHGGSLISRAKQIGYYLVTPFRLADKE